MSLIKRVTKQSPCPICGKPDFCFWKERKNEPGSYNLYCNRSSEAKGIIITGIDGNDYVAIYQTDAATIFEDVKQRQARTKTIESGEKKKYEERKFTVINSIEPLPHTELDLVYRYMLDQLPLYQFHAEYLVHEGWSMDMIKKVGVRSFPAQKISALPMSLRYIPSREEVASRIMKTLNINSLAGVPGAYIDDKGRWTFCSKSGIVFPVYDADGLIYRIRIRMDYLDLPVKMQEDEKGFYYFDKDQRVEVTMGGPVKFKDGEKIKIDFSSHKGKYRNFSSFQLDEAAYNAGFIENVFNKGCEAKNNLVYCMEESDDFFTCWITEGEKKGYFANLCIHQPVIAVPGVNSFGLLVQKVHGSTPLDQLRQKGVKRFVIAYDADRETNPAVMSNQNKLAALLKQYGFEVFIACWKMEYGKGLDDLLASGHVPYFYEYVVA